MRAASIMDIPHVSEMNIEQAIVCAARYLNKFQGWLFSLPFRYHCVGTEQSAGGLVAPPLNAISYKACAR